MMEDVIANKGTILFVGENIFWQCDFTHNFTPNIHRILGQGVDLKYSVPSTASAVGNFLSICLSPQIHVLKNGRNDYWRLIVRTE